MSVLENHQKVNEEAKNKARLVLDFSSVEELNIFANHVKEVMQIDVALSPFEKVHNNVSLKNTYVLVEKA